MIKGIGIDICQISRIDLSSYHRILTEEEIDLYQKIKLEKKKYEFLSGRFSAKEALFKALNHINHEVLMRDIVILNDDLGRPVVIKPKLKGYHIFISISHEVEYAVAQAIVELV
ncbi:holo-ACP synthase [Mycoplasmatota bacterium]|nr:holo-ACP synthase [Mycoplasmatota bacterium]